MKDGAILCNTGHFNVEIDIPALRGSSRSRRARRGTSSRSSRSPTAGGIYLLADGRLVNLSAAEGHPAIVMDMSFANQALADRVRRPERGVAREEGLPGARPRSTRRSRGSSSRRWASTIDQLTEEQAKYLASWDEGT